MFERGFIGGKFGLQRIGSVDSSAPIPPDTKDYLTFGDDISDRLYFGEDDYLYFDTV